MHVQTKLKRQKTAIKAPSKEPKEEDIVDDVLPAATLGLSEEGKAAMATLVKWRVPVCEAYDVEFRNVVEEHELGAGEELDGKVDLVVADPPYNVRRGRE